MAQRHAHPVAISYSWNKGQEEELGMVHAGSESMRLVVHAQRPPGSGRWLQLASARDTPR